MIREIKTEPIRYEEYWVLRGISDKNGVKKVVCEMEVVSMPTQEEIVTYMMIHNSEIDFVSVAHNYRLVR